MKKLTKGIFNIKILLLAIIILLMTTISFGFRVFAKDYSYSYDYYNEIKAAPASYNREKVLTTKDLGMDPGDVIVDVLILKNRKIIATQTKIYIYDKDYKKIAKIDHYVKNGVMKNFYGISSIASFFENKTTLKLYVAMSKKLATDGKIAILKVNDDDTLTYLKELDINDKSGIPGLKNFKPSKIAVSKTGAIYVLINDSDQGILELDENANFKRFVGTNKIVISGIEAFWRKLSPKNAKGRTNYVPVSFSSIAVDEKGFIYTTTSSKGSKPIQKLNFKGENVLLENGNTKVVGDIYEDSNYQSVFTDIAINDYGIYLGLDTFKDDLKKDGDRSKNRIFAYNSSGDLLYTIGNKGDQSKDLLEYPKLVRWDGNDIVVLDNGGNVSRLLVFKETEYGKNINSAVRNYENGNFQKSLPYWLKSLELNSNNELAYTGIGKVHLRNKEYESALENFKKANNKIYYSKAYEKIRNKKLTKAFVPTIVAVALFFVGLKGVFIWLDKKL